MYTSPLHLHEQTSPPLPRYTPGVGTKIDPTLCRADRLVGQVLGAIGALPDIYTELEISYFLLRRLLGVRTEGDKKGAKVRVSPSIPLYRRIKRGFLWSSLGSKVD